MLMPNFILLDRGVYAHSHNYTFQCISDSVELADYPLRIHDKYHALTKGTRDQMFKQKIQSDIPQSV